MADPAAAAPCFHVARADCRQADSVAMLHSVLIRSTVCCGAIPPAYTRWVLGSCQHTMQQTSKDL